ncbi:MAG: amino acid--tRNA ligase-related protein, partial [Rhodospirillaceae bacterium]
MALKRPYLAARNKITAATRNFFTTRDFLEVETPALQVSPGLEPHLQAFATELLSADPCLRRGLFLHTSPEFAMKKLLVAGLPRLFQLARVFRNGERSPTHHPEFTMLEWYRAGCGYHALIDDCIALVRTAAEAAGCTRLLFRGVDCDPYDEWQTLTVAEAFSIYTGIDLLATAPDPTEPDAELLAKAAAQAGVRAHEG